MGCDTNGEQVILATAGYDHTIKFWQAHTALCGRTFQHPDSQVNALEITNDRQYLAAAGYQHIRMYDLNSSKLNPVINYEGISKNVTAVKFNDSSSLMYTGGEDACARIWDIRAPNLNQNCQQMFQARAPINTICLHPNQVNLVIGDQSGIFHIWDMRSKPNGQSSQIPEQDASIQHVDVDADGNLLVCINNKGNCYMWDIINSQFNDPIKLSPRKKIEAHKRYGLKCKFSPNSTLLATTSADNTVKIWQTSDSKLLKELKTDKQRWVWDVAFSADSQYIITASSDTTARLWSIESGEVKREYSGHQKAITSLAFRDGS